MNTQELTCYETESETFEPHKSSSIHSFTQIFTSFTREHSTIVVSWLARNQESTTNPAKTSKSWRQDSLLSPHAIDNKRQKSIYKHRSGSPKNQWGLQWSSGCWRHWCRGCCSFDCCYRSRQFSWWLCECQYREWNFCSCDRGLGRLRYISDTQG